MSPSAQGQRRFPIEHEPVPADLANDLAFGLSLDGDLPAAVATRSGLASAPDPRAALPPESPPGTPPPATTLAGQNVDALGTTVGTHYTPDADTRRPDVLPYTDPFSPSTAPWKRLIAYDTVNPDFTLGVSDPRLVPLAIRGRPLLDGSEEQFFGDVVLDLRANVPLRVPSVGPGARIMHARVGIGEEDLPFELYRDSAENWFIIGHRTGRARLVYEMTIPRSAFGGTFGDVTTDLRFARFGSELPRDVARDAALVAAHIGLPKATPRESVETLVDYFRGFEESGAPLPTDRSIYLALAMSKQGVCRHRAYAFMVTAKSLGIASRVVMNEAHAWVEVFDGHAWKRVDLGGAGTILNESPHPERPQYAPPADPFTWPAGAKRGDDLGRTGVGTTSGTDSSGGAGSAGGASGAISGAPTSTQTAVTSPPVIPDGRPSSSVTLALDEAQATRGQPLHLRGTILADGVPCVQTVVTLSARSSSSGALVRLGDLATDELGTYAGTIVVPASVNVGDYDLVASTTGNAQCGAAVSK